MTSQARELLWLEGAEQRARETEPARREAASALVEAAHARFDAAAACPPSSPAPRCELLRGAVVLLLLAHAALREGPAEASTERAVAELGHHPELPDSASLRSLLETGGPLGFDRLGRGELEKASSLLEASALELFPSASTPSPQAVARARKVRLGAAAAAALAIALLAFGRAAASPNVAIGKPVTTSGLDPSSPPPGRLVDGESFGEYGVRTSPGRSPWVMIDLEGSYAIDHIVVRNRGDGSIEQSLPLVAEVSLDAQQFSEVGRRVEPFTQDEPWTLPVRKIRGRYVRLRVDKPGSLALTEAEIHGRR